jgi:hypothetical protein
MIRTIINAGICGFKTTVQARADDQQCITLEIASDCEKIRGLAADLIQPVDAYQEIGDGHDGVVLKAAQAHLKGCCAGCVVPSGIFKTVQVAGGVALPAPISLAIERVEEAGDA